MGFWSRLFAIGAVDLSDPDVNLDLAKMPVREKRIYAASGSWGSDAFACEVENNMVSVRVDVFEDLCALAGYKRDKN